MVLGSNSRPLGHETSALTTRARLLALDLLIFIIWLMLSVYYAISLSCYQLIMLPVYHVISLLCYQFIVLSVYCVISLLCYQFIVLSVYYVINYNKRPDIILFYCFGNNILSLGNEKANNL